MVAQLGPGQGQHGGGEEHGLVVRVGDEQADAAVAQGGKARRGDAHRVQVQRGDQQGHQPQGRQGRVHDQHVTVGVDVDVHGGRHDMDGGVVVEVGLLWRVGRDNWGVVASSLESVVGCVGPVVCSVL